jgi:hypothetical protein
VKGLSSFAIFNDVKALMLRSYPKEFVKIVKNPMNTMIQKNITNLIEKVSRFKGKKVIPVQHCSTDARWQNDGFFFS